MYTPQRPLFGAGQEHVIDAHLYPREDGYVDLVMSVCPRRSVDLLERATYARLTSAEAIDVLAAQLELLMVEESPS